MKVCVLAVLLFTIATSAHATTLQKNGTLYTLTGSATNASEAHKSGNNFAQQVGEILKVSYPRKVLNPSVHLAIDIKDGQEQFHIIWSCRIVKTSAKHADYYFDRRGTLMPGASPEDVTANVKDQIRASGKVDALLRSIRGAHVPRTFVQDSLSKSQEGYWYIQEYFVVAPK